MTKDAYTIVTKDGDELTLVAGDSDYVPVVKDLVAEGFDAIVAFWDHASPDLKREAPEFFSLNKYLSVLGRPRA